MFDYRTDEALEEIARNFYRRIGLEDRVRPDGMTVITKLKHIDTKFNYCRVPDREMPQAEAHWYSDEGVLSMRESVFQGMQRGDARSNFTFYHELAHYLLGHKGFLNRATKQFTKDISAPLVKHQEAEANRLASILMAPEHLVPEGATAEEISEKFGLSLPAAVLRKEEVERVRRRRRGELRPLPKGIVEFLKEARARGMNLKTNLDDYD
ncbi:ImmA/IrrE family metallo-endopeptidase [Afipia sp. DC4300-2b1]|uniref:ImmA/IrrE family metallo-endopeptidase n=1 Tax=Afipia sp. DC4300-2b1 TaxID=2804672 RepID=UPI003CEBB5BF